MSDTPLRFRSFLVFLGFLGAVALAAGLGGHATASGVRDWYPTLAKPGWTPPPGLFGPVWSVLYLAMAVVGWRLWRLPADGADGAASRKRLLALWWVQLAVNAAWSWAFFWARNPAAGLGVIGLLFILLCVMQPRLARADRPSALLWTPYVLWVGFAGALNLAIWHLN